MVCFFSGMTFLEGGGINDAITEVREKFFDTYKVFSNMILYEIDICR